VEVFDPASTRVFLCTGTSELLSETLADWIKNTFYQGTAAASLFVTSETAVKIFIPVVTVYYLRVAA
jgi:hypothetical protein